MVVESGRLGEEELHPLAKEKFTPNYEKADTFSFFHNVALFGNLELSMMSLCYHSPLLVLVMMFFSMMLLYLEN